MSDKSFGDLANRNIVKNPLLSTAVTGLSIEDLTHNAVLLPALPGQELTARQDKQQGVQMHTPRYTNSEFTNVPYGDAKPNTIQFNPPVHIDPPLSNVQTFDQFTKIPDIPSASQSKAPSKSDDDFDVNEYFARLQGTRYVSAPINSIIKEDQSANLQEEENLEEINLNEPDKGQSLDDVQQSLTADIAQNFSQLPTVIPQMASVVFSSFSNMLSLKNREQTPDADNKVYQEPVQKVDNTPMMMMNMPEVSKDIAPPPLKEPPTGIATTYRMTTKKKVYAQIPGLSSGDHHVPTFNPPPSSHAPPNYFVPDNVQVLQYQPTIENTVTVESGQHSLAPQTGIEIQHDISQTTDKNNIPNIFSPIDNDQKEIMGAPPDLMVPTQEKQSSLPKQEHITMVDTTNQSITMFNAPSTPIIPPPPMFSNMRRDSQTSSGKSVLPPSIARRISGSQPVIKTQAVPCFVPHENILMPTIPDPTDTSTRVSESTGQNLNQVSNQHSEVTNILPPNPYSNLNTLILPPSNASWNTGKDLVASDALYPESNVSQNDVYNAATMPAYTLFCTEPVVPANSNIFLDTKQPSINPSDKYIEQETVSASNISSVTADYFNPHLKDEKVNEIPVVVNSSAFTQAHVDVNRIDNILSVPQVQMSHNFHANTPAEAVKPLTEPPKLTGNVNYRMSNKRPQYYSGPIEGVGSIGGNINPIERPIERIPTLPSLEQIYFKASSAPYTHFMTPANTSNYLQNEPFDISKPMNAPYSSNNSAQQEQQFNTAFDLSRPTTDSHDKQTQDSKNFGIIGSLKSKINSLDVIKNTITNLLDPSFNVSRNNDSVNQDNDSHPENYTIEEDVQGNVVESVPSLTNNPKPPDEPSHNSNHLNPKIEIKYLSYGYYGDPNHQHPVRSRPPHSSILQNVILKNSVNQNAPLNQDINRTISESGQAEETMLNPKLDSGITTSSEQGEFSLNNRKDNIEYVSTKSDTGILMPKIFEYSDVNVPMKTGAASIQENNILNYSNKDQFQSKGNPPEYTPPTTATDNEKRNNSPRDFFNDLPKISQVLTDPSSKGFFDKETSIVLPFEAKKFEENINKSVITPELNLSKINISSNIQPCNTLVKNQESCELNLLEKKTTLQSSDLKHIPESILPPVELIKEDESKDYSLFRSDNTTANNINSAPMFSLFENSHLPAIPLFDISTLATNPLSIPTNINDMNDLQMKKENTSIFQSTDTAQDQNIFENLNTEVKENLIESPISELNICETCREVKKPEEKEVEDLTTQLIENITAPIQLENPVEFPVGEDFVEDQLVKVGPEGTIDIMKAQPPDDLLNDTKVGNAMLNYGWSTNETSQSTKALTDHDYGFQIDPKSVGFLVQEKCVFLEDIPANASDEIKAEFQNSYEDTTILPRQMSMPSAPPEEDSKSDESGLDVHSIEQDAKKDFPIFEEFVVEPSETDDHKIEYRQSEKNSDNSEPAVDTFTNRVERFKKDKDNTNEIKKEIKTFDLPTSTSPAITIASYFDTGNYAVENHYKNSLTSPSSLNTFNTDSNAAMRIPPGFEEEYHRRLSEISSQDILPVLKIQNLNINSVDINPLSTIKPLDDNICDATVESMIKELIEEDSIPAETHNKPASADDSELSNGGSKDKIPEPVNAFESNIIKTEDIKLDSLPDPINFFSSNVDSVQEPDAYSDFSRLSSYFTSPPKPEHSKSFFELSQSQNHYRHKPSKDTFDSMNNNVKMFFENLNSDNNLIQNNQNNNIPQISSQQISLVHDLTYVENLQPIDDIVRTVNYFTIDSITLPGSDLNTHKVTELKQNVPNETDDDKNGNNNFKDTDKNEIENVVNCKYCCQMTENLVNVANSRFKIRKNMDNNSENQKEANTDVKKEGIRKSMTVNFCDSSHQEDADDRIVVMSENRTSSEYSPVKHHWFYKVEYEGKSIWRGFSVADSRALEIAFNSPDLNDNTLVATDGGRYDVSVVSRLRTAVYWNETPTNVMRCSWFYKGTSIDPRYVPYSEDVAEKLEEEYRHGVTTGEWHRRLMLNNNELVVMHGPSVMVHFVQNSNNETFATSPQSMMRPRVVRRGYVESEIEDTEPSSIDHLLLLCHGVGSACDMRFRPVEEVVNDFRTTSVQLIQSHYKNSYDSGLVGRVEVLPISWHASLHTGVGVDSRLAAVTLDSIPRLRNFTNDTILDVLFYTSPVFCQLIIDTVCSELNRIYSLFKSRNPDFKGGVSLGGHSLGSVILYDLLCHQLPVSKEQSLTPDKTYITGAAGTGQPCVKYPALGFEPDALYALGSPIAIFECIRGVETLGKDFCLPTCKNFFNIFHPYDPIAYRIEPMINPQLRDVKPYLIPHHKGRKRMHLELKDTMARVGADIKQRVMESIKNTWSSMWKSQPPTDHHLEKVVEEEMEKEELAAECKEDVAKPTEVTADMLGKLNAGRRIDHVLQEAPFEMINEYLFAMSSHVCYWESEDTMLVMLREIYNALGVAPDCSLPQRTLSVERSRTVDDSLALSSESPSTSRSGS